MDAIFFVGNRVADLCCGQGRPQVHCMQLQIKKLYVLEDEPDKKRLNAQGGSYANQFLRYRDGSN